MHIDSALPWPSCLSDCIFMCQSLQLAHELLIQMVDYFLASSHQVSGAGWMPVGRIKEVRKLESDLENGHRNCMTSQLRPSEPLEFWYYQLYNSLPASFVGLKAESRAAAGKQIPMAVSSKNERIWNGE